MAKKAKKKTVDDIAKTVGRIRDELSSRNIADDLKGLRNEVENLARRVAALEVPGRGSSSRSTAARKPAASRSTAAKKPAASRSTAARKPAASRSTAAKKPAASRSTAAKKPAASRSRSTTTRSRSTSSRSRSSGSSSS
ncbi:MAG TPA: hypothetical protein VFM58_09550 [Solirubrobacteraceae bacterium]|jgi:hypothetical protein|nr:hypothetical protein [Solirubrobacteraceae bacterium]